MSNLPAQKVTQKTTIQKYRHTDLLEALFFIQDVLERAQIPFMALGNTALSIFNNEQDLSDPIHIGILKKYLMKANESTVRTLIKDATFNDRSIKLIHNNIPITIDIINNEYSFFKYPDKKFYYVEDFYLPNPFEKYYKVMNAII